MSIVAQCPHCETRFNLQADMNGKSMRCPNFECRQVFTVKAMEEKGPAPAYELPPEPSPPPPPKPTKPAKPAKPAATKPPKPTKAAAAEEPEVVDAVVVDAAVVSGPKEVEWSEGTDVPPPAPAKKGRKPLQAEAADDDLPVRRKRKNSRRPLVLAVMLIGIVGLIGFGAFYIIYFQTKNEEKLAELAKDQYAKGEYGDAAKSYDKLAKEYPGSKDIDKYKFFADLAAMQTVVRGVTNREDYDAAVTRLLAFIEAHKESPLAKPTSGFGRDVFEAGKQLGEAIGSHAEDRVKAYQTDRVKNAGELARADKAIAVGRSLVPALDPFRGADDPPATRVLKMLDDAEKLVKRERERTAAIDKAQAQLADPTDALIQSVIADLLTAGLLDDPEVQALIADAKGRLAGLVKYEDDPAAPQPQPPTAAASLLFVTPLGKAKLREPGAGDLPSGVFLCVARGILYALDEDTGALLWATRVGPDVTDPPAVARVQLDTGPADLAVVTSNVGNAPAVAGHVLKSGAPRWYQPLPAPAAGPAVVVGGRAFVPVRDAVGTVYEFDLTAGTRVGKIRLGQPVAERGAVLRPGTNLLYLAADARRVYVLDTGGIDDLGNRVNPRCAQVIATGHLAGTVRVPPLFVGPEGTDPADRWMILAQAEGTAKTLLRVFPVGPPPAPPADGATVPETPALPVVSMPVSGWVSSPPVTDGERLAVVTDTGTFRLFGVNQPGNADKPLFPFPAPAGASVAPDKTIPSLIIPVEEATYWLVANGQLQKARLGLVPSKGQEVVLTGPTLSVGEPLHAAQVNARKDTACVVVRSLSSSGCRAIAFDLHDGEVRWQRQLGLVPAKVSSAEQFAAPVAQGDKFVLVDEDGGVVAVPVVSGVAIGQTVAAPAAWGVAAAPAGATGPTMVVATPDGKTVYIITPVTREAPKFVVRRIADGKLAREDEVPAPAAIAGRPAIVGGSLLVPTADGFVNRFVPGDALTRTPSLVAGPPWLGERKHANAACAITPLTDTTFATSDGGKRLSRWEWPSAESKWNPAGSWELREAVAGPGVALPPAEPGGAPRFAVADVTGGVWLFAADRAGQPLRRWRPGGGSVIPAGKPSSGFAVQPAGPGRVVFAYVVDGKVAAAIDPDREEPLWAQGTGEEAAGATIVGTPQPAGANRWVVTDLAGRVVVLDGATGDVAAAQTVGLPGAVPAAASGVAANSALTPLSDGSAVVIGLPNAPEAPPKKE